MNIPDQASMSRRAAVRGEAPVLISDDDAVNRLFCEQVLASAGFSSLSASCGKEAIDLAQRWHPQTVLMDLHLPDMCGLDVITQLTGSRTLQLPQSAFIAMTADDSLDTRSELNSRFGPRVLIKPFDASKLLSLLGVASRSYPQEESAIPSGVQDLRKLFSDDCSGQLQRLDAALNQLDWAEAKRHLHKLQGAAAMSWLNEIESRCQLLTRQLPVAGVTNPDCEEIAGTYLNLLYEISRLN